MDRVLVHPTSLVTPTNVPRWGRATVPAYSSAQPRGPSSQYASAPLFRSALYNTSVPAGLGYMPASQRSRNAFPYLDAGTRSMIATQQAQERAAAAGAIGSPGLNWDDSTPSGGKPNVQRWSSQINEAIRMAQDKYGIAPPASLVKAMMDLESGGNPNAVSSAGYYGLMQVGAGSSGVYTDFDLSRAMVDPTYNIYAGVVELILKYRDGTRSAGMAQTWDNAVMLYHGIGWDGHTDHNGYLQIVKDRQLSYQQAIGGASGNPQQMNGQWGGNPIGQSIVNVAAKYQGMPYFWGGVPGKGVDPWSTQGWDCSGFLYWLDQNHGGGRLQMGSHYQYQQMQRENRIVSDMNALQPGDLIFWDTGNMAGGGAELNRAGHVSMYLGNGQMIHAANPSVGTVIVNVADFANTATFLGGGRWEWSGGPAYGGGVYPTGGGSGSAYTPQTRGVMGLPVTGTGPSYSSYFNRRFF